VLSVPEVPASGCTLYPNRSTGSGNMQRPTRPVGWNVRRPGDKNATLARRCTIPSALISTKEPAAGAYRDSLDIGHQRRQSAYLPRRFRTRSIETVPHGRGVSPLRQIRLQQGNGLIASRRSVDAMGQGTEMPEPREDAGLPNADPHPVT
jgi:hypothetical protein